MNKVEKIIKNFKIITSEYNGNWYLDIGQNSYWSVGKSFLTDPAPLYFLQTFTSREKAEQYGFNYLLNKIKNICHQ